MKRAPIAVVGILVTATVLGACGGPEEEEATTSEAVTCSPRMSVFPVGEAHNIGYDGTCGTGTCEVSCPDRNANSDWSAAAGHHGIDIFARRRAPLVAVASGEIVRVGVVSATSGLRVRLRDSCGWEYFYGHLDEAVVRPGQQVQAGQLIGYMGNTGTQGVHLHFNVSPDGTYSNDINPFQLLVQSSPTACAATPPPSGGCSGSSSSSSLDVRFFDAQFYLDLHQDLRQAFGPNNLPAARRHWIDHGRDEGRMASPVFHSAHYLAGHSDLRDVLGSTNNSAAVQHWIEYGICEGRTASPVFDARYYIGLHGDLQAAFGSTDYAAALDHYLNHGIAEGRRAHPDFDPTYYMGRYADLRNAFGATNYRAAILHWLVYGRREGRTGAP